MTINNEENIGKQVHMFANEKEKTHWIPICPICNNKNLMVRTVRKNKSKYYYCNNCRKCTVRPVFIDKKGEREKLICPWCKNSKLIRRGTASNNKQIYHCLCCSKYTTIPEIIREKLTSVTQHICATCNSPKLIKRGFDRYGKQVHYCSICQKYSVKQETCLVSIFLTVS
jgi:hypothetical protein